MHEDGEDVWFGARRHVHEVLRGFRDGFTRDWRDDLTQDASLAMWRFSTRHQQRSPIHAAVSTIVNRTRWAAIRKSARRAAMVAERPAAPYPSWPERDEHIRVEGKLVPVDWLLCQMREEIGRLRERNRIVLLAFYEGESCGQIAARLGSSVDAVRVRLMRARAQLKRSLEDRARAAGCFEA